MYLHALCFCHYHLTHLQSPEICCISGEAKDPKKDIPRAIIITLLVVTSLYCAASVGLAAMVPYEYISEVSGFPDGFRYRGYNRVAEITALGELTVLPLVVLVTIMAQPRLNFTMAKDGVLPKYFARVDEEGNLDKAGIKIAGIIMIAIATFVPFAYLDDLISSGILVAFTLTDTSVILVRLSSPPLNKPFVLEKLLIAFHILSFLSGILLRNCLSTTVTGEAVRILTVISCATVLYIGNIIRTQCPKKQEAVGLFLTPCVPTMPLCGCFVSSMIDYLSYTLCTATSYVPFISCYADKHLPYFSAGTIRAACPFRLRWRSSVGLL